MNVELLQQIKARILAEPDAFRMDTWSCGTAYCIGGWAMVLSGQQIVNAGQESYTQESLDGRSITEAAGELLDLSDDADCTPEDWFGSGSTQRMRLFHVDNWPLEFDVAFESTESRAEKARIAAERIDHFIATDGAE